DHDNEPSRARVPGSSSRPPVGQRAFTLQRRDLGVEQLVVHGDLADLGFQPGDLIVAVIAFTFFQGGSRACERTVAPLAAWRSRHSPPALPVPAACPATAGRQSPSCAESAPALLRTCARHHSSWVTLRLRF